MGHKLQIDAATNHTAVALAELSEEVQREQCYEDLRRLCERQSLYVVAMAQAEREREKVRST